MTLEEYDSAVRVLMEFAQHVENNKRPSYTAGHPDVLHNFVRDAESTSVNVAQNWAGHMLKQAHALARWAQDPLAPQSEPPISRFADLVNYAKLGFAIYKEHYVDDPGF